MWGLPRPRGARQRATLLWQDRFAIEWGYQNGGGEPRLTLRRHSSTLRQKMRLALCQVDPTIGDLAKNARKICAAAERAQAAGAELAVFPELSLVGYPPRDLLDRPGFVRAIQDALTKLTGQLPPDLPCLVGFVEDAPSAGRPALFNSAALIQHGRAECVARKRLLPTYDVFDDARYFAPGESSQTCSVAGRKLGVTICEDAWADQTDLRVTRYPVNPVAELAAQGAEIIINVAASPFTLYKREQRGRMLSEIARVRGLPVVFVNQVGGNDDVIFDGASAVFDAQGKVIARARSFAEDVCIASLETGGPVAEVSASDAEAALLALVLGTRDYLEKTGFSRAVIGLSGGIDSALTAAIAARALGPDNVLGIALPTRYSSEHSLRDAKDLADNLGIRFREIEIDDIFQSYLSRLSHHLDALGTPSASDVTFENIQARIRGDVLMAVSNRVGSLVLTTGNKSEIAVGYCTLYGDMAGALAVIADLPKCFVYEVARELNRQAGREVIPASTLEKPPSAELRPDQTDQDSLPPYETLDAILERYVEDHQEPEDIIAAGFERSTVMRVVRLVRQSEYKRRQMAPGLIVTQKAFASGRRYPIAQRFE